MIIPIRCFTCNNKIANKWELYTKLLEEENDKVDSNKESILTTNIIEKIKNPPIDDTKNYKYSNIGHVLNKLKINRYCCRRHFIGHIELIQYI